MTRTAFHIRPAELADAADIARLAGVLGYSADLHELSSRLAALLSDKNHFIAVAERDKAVLGWVAAENRRLLVSGEKVELTGLVVGLEVQREGVGKALVAAAEAWARDCGVHEVFVRSNINREQSHPFYESLGYNRIKTQHAYVKNVSG